MAFTSTTSSNSSNTNLTNHNNSNGHTHPMLNVSNFHGNANSNGGTMNGDVQAFAIDWNALEEAEEDWYVEICVCVCVF